MADEMRADEAKAQTILIAMDREAAQWILGRSSLVQVPVGPSFIDSEGGRS